MRNKNVVSQDIHRTNDKIMENSQIIIGDINNCIQ